MAGRAGLAGVLESGRRNSGGIWVALLYWAKLRAGHMPFRYASPLGIGSNRDNPAGYLPLNFWFLLDP